MRTNQILIFVVLLHFFSCKQSFEEDTANENPDTIKCYTGIKEAKKEFNRGNLIHFNFDYFLPRYEQVLLEDYEVLVFGGMPTVEKICFKKYMDSLIYAKYGKNIFIRAKQKSDSINKIIPSYLNLDSSFNYLPPNYKPELKNDSLGKYIYQQLCEDDKIDFGYVTTYFTINKLGQIEKARIIKSLSPELDSRTLRILYDMPPWEPAKSKYLINGDTVLKEVSYRHKMTFFYKKENVDEGNIEYFSP